MAVCFGIAVKLWSQADHNVILVGKIAVILPLSPLATLAWRKRSVLRANAPLILASMYAANERIYTCACAFYHIIL